MLVPCLAVLCRRRVATAAARPAAVRCPNPYKAVEATDDRLATNSFKAAEDETVAELNASARRTFLTPNIAAPNADTFMAAAELDDETWQR